MSTIALAANARSRLGIGSHAIRMNAIVDLLALARRHIPVDLRLPLPGFKPSPALLRGRFPCFLALFSASLLQRGGVWQWRYQSPEPLPVG